MLLPFLHGCDSFDFTATLDDMQSCTIIPVPENELASLEALQAHSGSDLGENLLIQILEVRISFLQP